MNRKERMNNTKILLKAELNRILELLEIENLEEKAELKNKMAEVRRDMVRLEKMLYNYSYDC